MSSTSSDLCKRCARVLEFDDSAFGVKCGSEEEGYFLGSRFLLMPDDEERSDTKFMDALPDLRVLSTSSRNGCHFCAMLILAIRQCEFTEQYILVSYQLAFSYRGNNSTFHRGLCALIARIFLVKDKHVSYLRFQIDGPPGKLELHSRIIDAYLTYNCKCRDWLRLESSPEEVALCQKNVQWLRQNLFEEGTSLPAQTETHTTSFRPLRLIHVEPEGSYDCRLVVANKKAVSPPSPYLALSYCWGNPEDTRTQFKTETNTIDDRRRGFLLEELPQCIRDAVEVSRALGVHYLWVDALCILQDDESDWEIQSAQMARIYRNAIAVICAAASRSCHQGFLERNKTSASIKFQSHIDPTISGHFNIRFHSKVPTPLLGCFGASKVDVLASGWATRGWTYQEFYLAQRAIIFGTTTIHCRSSDVVWSENKESTRDGNIISLDNSSIQEEEDTSLSGWINAITDFAIRHFSSTLDRLPGISGLAETVSAKCPDHYLAGIRKSHLHRDLIWALNSWQWNPSTANARTWAISSLHSPVPYIAPSWSWASRREGIFLASAVRQLMFGLPIVQDFGKEYSKVETHVSVIGQNPYGRVSHGSLTFFAIVVPLWARLETVKPFWTEFLKNQYPVSRENLRHHTGDDFSARVLLDWVTSERDQPIDGLWFFLLGSCYQRGNSRTPRDWSSSSESEDEPNDAIRSDTEGSNDDSGDDQDEEEEPVEQTTSTAVDDADYDSQSSGSGYTESENGMEQMPTRQENHRDEASSETHGEPDRKASASDLSTAPPSSHESEERANHNESDDLFETESEPGTQYSEDDSYEGRIAYVLIIHPTGKPGQFFRVGIWASHDIDFFQGRQESTFELI